MRFLSDITSGAITLIAVNEHHYAAAEALIVRHADRKGLRTLDALQLAIALETHTHLGLDAFVVADKSLAEIAEDQALPVMNPETT